MVFDIRWKFFFTRRSLSRSNLTWNTWFFRRLHCKARLSGFRWWVRDRFSSISPSDPRYWTLDGVTNPIFYHWSIIGMCRHSIKPPVEKTISTTWFECFGFGECFACRVWVASKTCALFSSCFSLICSGSLSFFTLLFVFFSRHATNEQVRPIILPPPKWFSWRGEVSTPKTGALNRQSTFPYFAARIYLMKVGCIIYPNHQFLGAAGNSTSHLWRSQHLKEWCGFSSLKEPRLICRP